MFNGNPGPGVTRAAAPFSFSCSTGMSSRSAYTAITPEYANFTTPQIGSPIPSGLNPSSSSSTLQSEEREVSSVNVNVQFDEEGNITSRINSWLTSAKDVMQRNTGLLLFILSQAFVTFMNLAVKLLNTIDPPVTALEVCLL